MNSKCKDCKFWLERPIIGNIVIGSKGKKNGNCLRFPPQYVLLATPQGLGSVISFVSTEEDQWCGEYKDKQPAIQPTIE